MSQEGRRRALSFNIETITLKRSGTWDNKWRIVLFDIPEMERFSRDILCLHLRQLGFIELQHSVWVTPRPCKDEIDYIIEFYNIRKYVRTIIATNIDNELDLKHRFGIT